MNKKNTLIFLQVGWIYTKYQLLTKSILLWLIFPLFRFLTQTLIETSGRTSITSGDYLGFIFSVQGIGLLILALIILVILIGVDINAFIIMSALIKENKSNISARKLLYISLKSLKFLTKPAGVIVILYTAVVVPLVGIGISISVTENFKIPNFIMDVIYHNKLYYSLYIMVMILLSLITIVYIFFFHYALLENQSIGVSLKNSFNLMKKHWKEFIKEFFIKHGLMYIALAGLLISIIIAMLYFTQKIPNVTLRRFSSIFALLSAAELISYITLMIIPVLGYELTNLFYKFNREDGHEVIINPELCMDSYSNEGNRKANIFMKFALVIFFVALIAFNFLLSFATTYYFEDVFRPQRKIEIVAHRGGGNLASENSVLGMEKAAVNGAKWSEIDVQRTKDGAYVINHDSTFNRVAGVDKKAKDMTLSEVQQLKIKNLFDESEKSQPVPTLEDFLDASKGKIGVFIELKGETADKKMADDVIRLVREKNMEKEVAILSLDYNLISYIEEKYPKVTTGYLYFFSVGDCTKLKGDILIMEEGEATADNISKIHEAGKKAVVWTVNTDESIENFVSSEVDGIITDYVNKVRNGVKERDDKPEVQVILEKIFSDL